MSMQYASKQLHQYFLMSGTLHEADNLKWDNIWDQQEVPFDSALKCPRLGEGMCDFTFRFICIIDAYHIQ